MLYCQTCICWWLKKTGNFVFLWEKKPHTHPLISTTYSQIWNEISHLEFNHYQAGQENDPRAFAKEYFEQRKRRKSPNSLRLRTYLFWTQRGISWESLWGKNSSNMGNLASLFQILLFPDALWDVCVITEKLINPGTCLVLHYWPKSFNSITSSIG